MDWARKSNIIVRNSARFNCTDIAKEITEILNSSEYLVEDMDGMAIFYFYNNEWNISFQEDIVQVVESFENDRCN